MFKSHAIAATLALTGTTAFAQVIDFSGSPFLEEEGVSGYEVTVTNITPGQTFTPQMVVTHAADISLFQLGEPASMD